TVPDGDRLAEPGDFATGVSAALSRRYRPRGLPRGNPRVVALLDRARAATALLAPGPRVVAGARGGSRRRRRSAASRRRISRRDRRPQRSEEHTSELQSRGHLVCRLLLEKKKRKGAGY